MNSKSSISFNRVSGLSMSTGISRNPPGREYAPIERSIRPSPNSAPVLNARPSNFPIASSQQETSFDSEAACCDTCGGSALRISRLEAELDEVKQRLSYFESDVLLKLQHVLDGNNAKSETHRSSARPPIPCNRSPIADACMSLERLIAEANLRA